MPRVLIATSSLFPDGEDDGALIVPAMAARGIDAAMAVWSDPAVDWSAADLVLVRSTWDYHRRPIEFLAWAAKVAKTARVLNAPATLRWSSDKSYLLALGEHVPVVPTRLLDEETLVPGLEAALAEWGEVVVKPRTGASGVGVVLLTSLQDRRIDGLVTAPWIVQPLVTSIRTEGETSVWVMTGRAVSALQKTAAGGEIRIHTEYGGSAAVLPLTADAAGLAESAVAAAGALLAEQPSYARVDMVRHDGRLVVSELELIEPGLSLDLLPENAEHLADAVGAALAEEMA